MVKSLKIKILAGFMLLIALLIVAGTVSVIEFLKLSRSVNALIEDNYKTIEATKTMLEALERNDSGILLYLLGEKEKGRKIINSSELDFARALKISKNNITELNEKEHVDEVENRYNLLQSKLLLTLNEQHNKQAINWYHDEVYQSFLDVKHAVNGLMSLNQNSMYKEATILKDKSHRAIMPGIVAIVGSLIFSMILSFFISRYFITPLSSLSEAIRTFHLNEKQLHSNIKSEDEIKKIEVEVNNLITRLVKSQEPKN
jgi:methyl-accepting chemotaxis protein